MSELDLPMVWERKIGQIIHDNRMLYEPRMETATSFNELRSRLRHRGFRDLPMGASPLLNLSDNKPVADTSSAKVKKTMIRKKK